MSMNQLGVAVVGAGFIGPVHVEALRRVGVHLTGILGVDRAESERAATALGLPRAYRDYEQVLSDPEVHAVHITTPNRLHFAMAKAALRGGRHVMCEKPLAMNSRESAQLVKLAAQVKRAAGVNYNIRFYPLCLEAREMIRQGDCGEVFSVVGSYVQDWLLYPTDYNWRVVGREGGALRAVADIGTHWLDLAQAVTGLHVEAVCANLKTVHPVRHKPRGEVQTFTGKAGVAPATDSFRVDTEDCGAVLLRWSNGATGVLWVSQVTAGRKNCLRFEISGSRRALAWNSEEPNEMWVGHRGQANQSILRDPSQLSPAARAFSNYPGGHAEGFPDTFKQCFKAFYGYIQAGDFQAPPPFPTFHDGHREVVLCEAILKSHRSGRWVKLR